MSRYDTRTTTFSQEGRIFQVEYALEAINNASSTLGLVTSEGIIIAADHFVSTKLLDPGDTKEKLYVVDDHIVTAVAGWTADANVLLNHARVQAQRYRFAYNVPISVEDLVVQLCDIKQMYTQFGGLRPFGVSFLVAGFSDGRFQLILTDPAGNYGCWKATAVGQNSVTAQSILKQEWTDTLTLDQGLKLAARVLTQVTDAGGVQKSEAEFAVLHTGPDGKIKQRFLTQSQAAELMKGAAASGKIVVND